MKTKKKAKKLQAGKKLKPARSLKLSSNHNEIALRAWPAPHPSSGSASV